MTHKIALRLASVLVAALLVKEEAESLEQKAK